MEKLRRMHRDYPGRLSHLRGCHRPLSGGDPAGKDLLCVRHGFLPGPAGRSRYPRDPGPGAGGGASVRLRHGAHVPEAGGRLHSAEPGRSLWPPTPTGSAPPGTAPCPTAAASAACSPPPPAGSLRSSASPGPRWPCWLWSARASPGADGAAGGPAVHRRCLRRQRHIDTVFVLSGEGTMADIDAYRSTPPGCIPTSVPCTGNWRRLYETQLQADYFRGLCLLPDLLVLAGL